MRKTLKNSRRSPLAAIFVIAAGLILSGGSYALATNAVEVTTAKTAISAQEQIKEGEKLFLANCATCHGVNGVGTKAGPTVIGVGAASADFQVSSGRMPGQASGPQMPPKPVQFTEEQIAAIAAYVGSLGVGPRFQPQTCSKQTATPRAVANFSESTVRCVTTPRVPVVH